MFKKLFGDPNTRKLKKITTLHCRNQSFRRRHKEVN